jgi:hypothetical protein
MEIIPILLDLMTSYQIVLFQKRQTMKRLEIIASEWNRTFELKYFKNAEYMSATYRKERDI